MYVYLQIALVKLACLPKESELVLHFHPEDTIIVPEQVL